MRKYSALLLFVFAFGAALAYVALSECSPSTKTALLRDIDPTKQRYDSVYLSIKLKEKYGYSFEYGLESTLETLQFPDIFISNSTTEELAIAVFGHVETEAISCYNDRDFGFSEVYKRFNGLRELINRKDAGIVITSIYLNLKLFSPGDPDVLTENFFFVNTIEEMFKVSSFRALFSEDEIRRIIAHAKESDRYLHGSSPI